MEKQKIKIIYASAAVVLLAPLLVMAQSAGNVSGRAVSFSGGVIDFSNSASNVSISGSSCAFSGHAFSFALGTVDFSGLSAQYTLGTNQTSVNVVGDAKTLNGEKINFGGNGGNVTISNGNFSGNAISQTLGTFSLSGVTTSWQPTCTSIPANLPSPTPAATVNPVASPTPVVTPSPNNGTFNIGDTVSSLITINARTSAAISNNVIRSILAGTQGKIVDGPVSNGGFTWWHIVWSDGFGTDGWSVQGDASIPYLSKVIVTPSPIPTTTPIPNAGTFVIGDHIKVNVGTLKVRSTAGGTPVGSISLNQTGTVVDGPVQSGAYTWWKINWDNGTTGWSAEGDETTDFLVKTSSAHAQSGQFQNGDTVQVEVDNLNVRSSPGGSIVGKVNVGNKGLVIDGPVDSGGFRWWKISFNTGSTLSGWSAEGVNGAESVQFLTKASQ